MPIFDYPGPPSPADARCIRVRYSRPHLMHGSIGPSCAMALWENDGMTVWTHSQGVYPLRKALAELLKLDLEKVRCIHVEGSGCYGHNGADDVAADAALAARAVPGRPVRLQWMREQEHGWEPLGSAMVVEMAAELDGNRIASWRHDVWSNTHSTRPTHRRRPAGRPRGRSAVRAAHAQADPDAGGRRRAQRQPDLCAAQRARRCSTSSSRCRCASRRCAGSARR